MMQPPTKVRARLGVVETVYHQSDGEQPYAAESRFSRELQTDEQPLPGRRFTVGEDWQPLETGWIKQAGMLVIRNEEGHFPQVQPTEQERAHAAAKVIELSAALPADASPPRTQHDPAPPPLAPAWVILPRESHRGNPADLAALRIRCRPGGGSARCTVTLFPE